MIKYNEDKNIIQIEERLFEIEIKRGDVNIFFQRKKILT